MLDEKTLSDVMRRRPAKVVTIQSKNTQWHVERVIKAIFARIAFTIRLINIKDREIKVQFMSFQICQFV